MTDDLTVGEGMVGDRQIPRLRNRRSNFFPSGMQRCWGFLVSIMLAACSVSQPSAEVSPDQTPGGGPVSPAPLSDEEARQWMGILLEYRGVRVADTIERVIAVQDRRFIPVFIELLRASEIGLVNPTNRWAYLQALGALTGESYEEGWPAWVEWYGATDLQPPPGFTSWKGKLYARIDPRFTSFLKDDLPSRIRVEEIQWGGVSVDGIPALDNPEMIPADQADYLTPGEPVFGIELNGERRAYPLRILDWHEMANDVVGGVPLSLAYCTLCGAGIAFQTSVQEVPGDQALTFGSSGLLYRSNKLMYDRQTETLWNQLTGEPVLGELAGSSIRLPLLPVVLTRWEDWRQQHPDTTVLALDTGHDRVYELGAAYASYFASDETMFPVWRRSDLLPAKARVYALYLDGVPKAYWLDALIKDEVLNDTLGQTDLVLVARRGAVEVTGVDMRSMRLSSGSERESSVTYESGGEVRAYQRAGHIFAPGPDLDSLVDEKGCIWKVGEDALFGPGGQTAARLPGHLAYWFGWYAFFPDTELYGVH